MKQQSRVSRRRFLGSAISAAAVSSLPLDPLLSASPRVSNSATARLATSAPGWRDQGVLNLAHSRFAKLQSVPVRAVTVNDGFWAARRKTNVEKSIPSMEKLLEANGRLDNFLRLVGKSGAPQSGPVYSDSDIYKWDEAAAFALQSGDRPELRALVDKTIKDVVAVQQPDGYLNTYYVDDRAKDRMTTNAQRWGHELYCIGHLLQGAIAYYRATGDTTLLDAGSRFVDDFLLPSFGPGPDKKPIFSGHPEIEMALVELYRTTGDKRHLELAGYILHSDDRIKFPPNAYVYHFCGLPFTSRTHLEGHAVRAMYACCGAADYYMETGDQTYWDTLNTLWEDLVKHQMYVTGGVGARSDGEAFGDSYELPNFTAYGESCAAIGNMMWNWRMLAANAESKYADVIERALYNGINSGMSLDGTLYCYRNPLGFDPSNGDKIRNPWYDTTCCPPNIERTFASLPGYFYSTSKDGLYVHLYDNSVLDWRLEDGTVLQVRQKTNYPWEGTVDMTVTPERSADFTIFLRIPEWSDHTSVTVNGRPVSDVQPGRYLAVRRQWSPGDTVQLKFDMTPRLLQANSRVVADFSRAAVQRGPLVYCLEEIDQPAGVALMDAALDVGKGSGGAFESTYREDLLGGVFTLKHAGAVRVQPSASGPLYSRFDANPSKMRAATLTFIPYYAWANRASTPMQVWIPVRSV